MNPNDMIDTFRRKGSTRCIEIGRLIQGHLDAGLDEATSAKVADHLNACRRCRLAAADYRRLKTALSETAAPVPAEPLERLHALAADLASGRKNR